MNIKYFMLYLGLFFLTSCGIESNLVVKRISGDYLVVSYGDSRQRAEYSAALSAERSCGGSKPLIKYITTEYVATISEKEAQIANKVLDMLDEMSEPKDFDFKTKRMTNPDSQAYRTDLVFICE